MKGEALKYPDRKRCMRCRSYFGFLVLDGLYDSYECAGLPVPPLVRSDQQRRWIKGPPPPDWPREHFVWKWWRYRVKLSWASQEEAVCAAEADGKNAYVCNFCQQWHIGSSRKQANIA